MLQTQSAQIRVVTCVNDEFHATLLHLLIMAEHRDAHITLIHESADGKIRSYDFKDEAGLHNMPLIDCDTLYITVRHNGDIIGVAVLEVQMTQVDAEGAVLCPYVLQLCGFEECLLRNSDAVKAADAPTLETQKVEVRG